MTFSIYDKRLVLLSVTEVLLNVNQQFQVQIMTGKAVQSSTPNEGTKDKRNYYSIPAAGCKLLAAAAGFNKTSLRPNFGFHTTNLFITR